MKRAEADWAEAFRHDRPGVCVEAALRRHEAQARVAALSYKGVESVADVTGPILAALDAGRRSRHLLVAALAWRCRPAVEYAALTGSPRPSGMPDLARCISLSEPVERLRQRLRDALVVMSDPGREQHVVNRAKSEVPSLRDTLARLRVSPLPEGES